MKSPQMSDFHKTACTGVLSFSLLLEAAHNKMHMLCCTHWSALPQKNRVETVSHVCLY